MQESYGSSGIRIQQNYGASGGYGRSTSGGPLGGSNPNMVWDEARQGYWVKETVVDNSSQNYDTGGGYSVYGGESGKIIRRTHCCDEPEPNIIVHNHKKIVHCDDSDDEITIVTPPPVVVMPQAPPTNVFIMPPCCPEKKPCGPSTFFPEVREKSYRMETQTRSGPCMSSAPCVSVSACSPCGGAGRPACGRCFNYHR